MRRPDAVRALDDVGDGDVVVVGNSIGGSCAIEVARLAPAKVKALVLSGAKPGHRPEPGLRDEALALLDHAGVRAAWDRYWLPLFGPDAAQEVVDSAFATASRLGPALLSAGVRAFHGRADRHRFLVSWQRPVFVVSGQFDLSPDRALRLSDELPQGAFRLVADAGHYVPLEAPRALTGIVRDALAAAR